MNKKMWDHVSVAGLQTVGIFRVGSSKKRVRQVRILCSFNHTKWSWIVGLAVVAQQ